MNRNTNEYQTVVLLLAGGVGSRLNNLVQTRAKPAVPFGGLYRIIDFSLSNVMNSGLTQVGVLTQYKPLSLMRHLRSGEAWDFTGRTRGVKILPPRTGAKDSDWYQGTADAVRQNIDFLKAHPSKEVLILSGDHIYQMDLEQMIEFHRAKKADVTVAMMEVDLDKIHQFGTGITDDEGRIVEWEEKPEHPRTNLASMGIYVFDTAYLLETLSRDRREIDFGMHIIPRAIEQDQVFAYPFHGYWRDVGTIQALWEANMDILREDADISPEGWGIRSNPETDGNIADRCPARFATGCRVSGSMIAAGCVIEGEVVNSVLSPGVVVRAGASVRDSVVFTDCLIAQGAKVDLAILDKRVRIGVDAIVGIGEDKDCTNRLYPKHLYTGISLIGKDAWIGDRCKVGRNAIIQPGSLLEPDSELTSGESF
ncbi:MAG: NTP transferase domain-containing protein [Proteobacteria bacterium]|nr:NTP transferase domain-containing protein [Pseudomonadota bacterium]MBU1686106.1 NTP transferase domain-containing protein [Pseudomonadota bacterium]